MDVASSVFEYFCSDAFHVGVFLKSSLTSFHNEMYSKLWNNARDWTVSLLKWFQAKQSIKGPANDHCRDFFWNSARKLHVSSSHGNLQTVATEIISVTSIHCTLFIEREPFILLIILFAIVVDWKRLAAPQSEWKTLLTWKNPRIIK